MKRRLLIFSSLITLLLSCFSFPICAEESIEDIEELAQVNLPDYALDQYFYDNYVLLPYIQSTQNQYINTGIKAASNLKIFVRYSDLVKNGSSDYSSLFGETQSGKNLYSMFRFSDNNLMYYFANQNYEIEYNTDSYVLNTIIFDQNKIYLNNNLIHTFNNNSFTSDNDLTIFATYNGSAGLSYGLYKLYYFSIYDYESEQYVRFYYPAKSKAGGVIGLYDSISKTFVTTSGSVPFSSPIDDQVISFQINDFLDASLNWIEAIFLAIIEMPIIIVFMAISLAGVFFRWSRKLVHF